MVVVGSIVVAVKINKNLHSAFTMIKYFNNKLIVIMVETETESNYKQFDQLHLLVGSVTVVVGSVVVAIN